MKPNLEVEFFDNNYILMVVDYVSKWVESTSFPSNQRKSVTFFLKKHIFTKFGTPQAILSDDNFHFCNWMFSALL